MRVVCIRMLLSAFICLSTLQKHEGGFVLILKSAWGVLSTLYYWAWGVLSAFKKTCGGFCPHIPKWTWGVLSVGCFVLHSSAKNLVENIKRRLTNIRERQWIESVLQSAKLRTYRIFKSSIGKGDYLDR